MFLFGVETFIASLFPARTVAVNRDIFGPFKPPNLNMQLFKIESSELIFNNEWILQNQRRHLSFHNTFLSEHNPYISTMKFNPG